jgi:hypothetical protein
LASAALCNSWLTTRIADLLWQRIKAMLVARATESEAKALTDAINSDEALLSKLGAERQTLLRELEPHASFAFATELAALVQELRGPVVGVVSDAQIWKRRPERKDERELDLAKYVELVSALDLTPASILDAFNLPHTGQKT